MSSSFPTAEQGRGSFPNSSQHSMHSPASLHAQETRVPKTEQKRGALGVTSNSENLEGKPGDLVLMSKSARNEIHNNASYA